LGISDFERNVELNGGTLKRGCRPSASVGLPCGLSYEESFVTTFFICSIVSHVSRDRWIIR
jgi:hypothetical protein